MKSWIISLALAFAAVAPTHAYGPEGHRIVGGVADQLLRDSHAAAHVKALLRGITLQRAATLADELKDADNGDANFDSQNTLPPQLKAELLAFHAANSGLPGQLNHRNFHFTDVPISEASYDAGTAGRDSHDVVHMISYCIGVLQGTIPADNDRKVTPSVAVVLLAHYVGDIHQPLHVGADYFDAQGHELNPDNDHHALSDVGGNNILFEGTRLHAFWDVNAVAAALKEKSALMKLPADQKFSDSTMIQTLATYEPANWKVPTGTPLEDFAKAWANEILPLAREAHARLHFSARQLETLGKDTIKMWPATETQPPAGGVSYDTWAGRVVAAELGKGGWRLADLFKQIWP